MSGLQRNYPTPERAACGDIPARYCSALAVEEHSDWAVVLLATDEPDDPYPLQVICHCDDDGWHEDSSSNGSGCTFTDERHVVVTLWKRAPAGASTAHVLFEGEEHRVPVRRGHFLFCAWDTVVPDDDVRWWNPDVSWLPRVVAFT